MFVICKKETFNSSFSHIAKRRTAETTSLCGVFRRNAQINPIPIHQAVLVSQTNGDIKRHEAGPKARSADGRDFICERIFIAEIRKERVEGGFTPAPGFRKLDEQVFEPEFQRMSVNRIKFIDGDFPVQFRIFLRGYRPVLAHQAQRKFFSEFQKQRGDRIDGIIRMAREDQVSNEDAPGGRRRIFPGPVQEALLAYHFPDGLKSDFRVIAAAGKPGGEFSVRIFEIRQIYVNEGFGFLDDFHGLIARKIEDDRDIPARFSQHAHQPEHVREEMIGCNHVDVVDSECIDHMGYLSVKFREPDRGAQPVVGDLVILAVAATQRAAGEKDRAGTFGSGKRRFLAEVRAHICNPEGAGFSAVGGSRSIERSASEGTASAGAEHARVVARRRQPAGSGPVILSLILIGNHG